MKKLLLITAAVAFMAAPVAAETPTLKKVIQTINEVAKDGEVTTIDRVELMILLDEAATISKDAIDKRRDKAAAVLEGLKEVTPEGEQDARDAFVEKLIEDSKDK